MTIVWDRAELQKSPIRRNNEDKEFWHPGFNIVVAAGPAKLEFWSEIKGKRRGEVMEVKYNEPLRHHSLRDAFCCAQQTGMYMHRLWKQLSYFYRIYGWRVT
jgi:hypothetical protein